MDKKYEKAIEAENKIYTNMKDIISIPQKKDTECDDLNKVLDWLCDGTETVLDFGCGSGTLLFMCANRGTKQHYGIDLASEGIAYANSRARLMTKGEYHFSVGSIEELYIIEDSCMDGIILSNIIDNMYPEDVHLLLKECKRILKDKGKMFIKLNPFISDEQIAEWNLKEIETGVYDDGFILWNRKTKEWIDDLSPFFEVVNEYEFFIPQVEQVNRIFLLIKLSHKTNG